MAKQTVSTFVKDLELEIYESANNVYPTLNKIGKIWILSKFQITDAKIDNEEITIYGKFYKNGSTEAPISFLLSENSNGNYVIAKSKGLSAYYGSNEYIFFKKVHCLEGLETDEEISAACNSKMNRYNFLVNGLKSEIEKSINKKLDYLNEGDTHDGYQIENWKITNDNPYNVPEDSYTIRMYEMTNIHDNQGTTTGNYIPITHPLPTLYAKTWQNISLMYTEEFNLSYPIFEITDTEFIKEYMANKNDWGLDCAVLFDNL